MLVVLLTLQLPVAVPLSGGTVTTWRVTPADQWGAHDVSVTGCGRGNYRAGGRRGGRLAGYHRQRRPIHPLQQHVQSSIVQLIPITLHTIYTKYSYVIEHICRNIWWDVDNFIGKQT